MKGWLLIGDGCLMDYAGVTLIAPNILTWREYRVTDIRA